MYTVRSKRGEAGVVGGGVRGWGEGVWGGGRGLCSVLAFVYLKEQFTRRIRQVS